MFQITDVRCEYMVNPLGIDKECPRISWKFTSNRRNVVQTAYQIQVSPNPTFSPLEFDSGKVESDRSVHVSLDALQLKPRTRYFYRVRVWNNDGEVTPWSDIAFWETGMIGEEEWRAKWISAPAEMDRQDQCPMLRRTFRLDGRIRLGRIYATALGLYELRLNGKRVGDAYFTPGWTSYHHRLQYQTYDVTHLLQEGDNAIGAILGNGWYRGDLGWKGNKQLYGDRRAFFMQMHVHLENGEEVVIVSDESWKSAPSPILMSEIYHGEIYDARLELPGWDTTSYDDTNWQRVDQLTPPSAKLVAQENEPVRKVEEIRPVQKIITPEGDTVLDLGQNMVGWIRFSIEGQPGQTVKIEHAEVLDRDGNFYTENLRSARQTVSYTLKGNGLETFEPHFTFQGFRYVRLSGFKESQIQLENFTGVVLHSDMEPIGEFQCSDPLINQLQHNIIWGMKGNFLDVPTDCPQRDERLGWTGDAQMFIRTAAYLMNVGPFFSKWLQDLACDQAPDGGVPFVVPNVLGEYTDSPDAPFSSAAWGDAAVICPWTLYVMYGDANILEQQYESMKAWVEYIRRQGDNEYLWNTGFHFGDWLGLDAKPGSYVGATDRDFIATAFYAYSVSLLQKTASVLGKIDDAREYEELHKRIVQAFRKEFVTPSGRLAVPTQTAHVLALMFGLLDDPARQRAEQKLIELIKEEDDHLTTGFVGTPYLNHVLTRSGHLDVAYKLLFQKDFPSWLYQITKGATTIWEHWDGIKEDGTFWSANMNSFNHYAYGAIGDWLYQTVAGIQADEQEPGFKKFRIAPLPGEQLDWAEGRLNSMYGMIRSYWHKKENGGMEIEVTIPANTKAEIILPAPDPNQVRESGTQLTDAVGILEVAVVPNGVKVIAGSGNYRFEF